MWDWRIQTSEEQRTSQAMEREGRFRAGPEMFREATNAKTGVTERYGCQFVYVLVERPEVIRK